MAFYRSPLYHFADVGETGIDQVPPKCNIFIDSTGLTYIKETETGLTPTSTITDAISGDNIVIGDLKPSGEIPMATGYSPVNDQDIATKISVVNEIVTRLEANLLFDAGLFGGYQY